MKQSSTMEKDSDRHDDTTQHQQSQANQDASVDEATGTASGATTEVEEAQASMPLPAAHAIAPGPNDENIGKNQQYESEENESIQERIPNDDSTTNRNTPQAVAPGAFAVNGSQIQHRSVTVENSAPRRRSESHVEEQDLEEEQQQQQQDQQQNETQGQSASIQMVQAELVPPPIEAYQVTIDEDPVIDIHETTGGSSHPPFASMDIEGRNDMENDEKNYRKGSTFRRRRLILRVGGGCMCLVCLVVVILTVLLRATCTGCDDESALSPMDGNDNEFCYTSTADLIGAQLNTDFAPSLDHRYHFVICPNTIIDIGKFENPSADNYRMVDGDYPVWVFRPNVTIQCGWDGNPNNNCILSGGFLHVVTQNVIFYEGTWINVTTTVDNMIIRGLTFTADYIASGPFQGGSVVLSQVGSNIRFEDCIFRDITAYYGLMLISKNLFQEISHHSAHTDLEDQSVDVTFSGCTFDDIIYDTPFFFVQDQRLTIERSIFRNVIVSESLQPVCPMYNPITVASEGFEGCASLVYCSENSACNVQDVCVESMEYSAPSFLIVTNETEWTASNVYLKDVVPKSIGATSSTYLNWMISKDGSEEGEMIPPPIESCSEFLSV